MIVSAPEKGIQQYSDAEVIEHIIAGNKGMFEILIRRYNPFLYKTGRGYGFNHQDTEDLMQETFVNTYLNLKQFAGRASFKTWIIKIMLNECYHKSHKYSYQKEQATEILPGNSSFMFSDYKYTDNSRSLISKEFNNIVEATLQKLPDDYRMTFTLRELTGLSVAETADIMQTTASNVKVRLNRAKAMLRKEIEKTYTPEDIYEFNLIYCDRIVDAVMKRVYELEDEGGNK
ncbi:MAG TPA: sigma-70 family RNA polymerase sigma factor [Parafilimonas sp.]|nr:sigma-70 family RNA polymerase sigma factor [Parafilimonas sp.]